YPERQGETAQEKDQSEDGQTNQQLVKPEGWSPTHRLQSNISTPKDTTIQCQPIYHLRYPLRQVLLSQPFK
ncbi:hypothetical protein A2U01_0092348, partial [Trifolium medium]|nr:hypothetical protein [Trifolium medium]